MVLLSATMIVRNEATHLEACLLSFRDLVDEVVIVDTGSTDGTHAIARRLGARVIDFPWCDDFSAARNEALRFSGGVWSLYIDADERVRPTSRQHLRALLRNPSAIAYYVLRHPGGVYTPYWEMRLFRKDPLIRFEGVVHEQIWPGILRYRAARGGGVGHSGVVIDHLSDDSARERKHHFYLPLLLKELERNPGNVYCWSELGSAYLTLGDSGRAREAWRAGVAAVRRQARRRWADIAPYAKLIQFDLETGQAVGDLLKEALALFPGNAHLLWLRGLARARARRYSEAIEDFERLARWPTEPHPSNGYLAYDERMFGALTYKALGMCHLKLGRESEGQRYLELSGRLEQQRQADETLRDGSETSH